MSINKELPQFFLQISCISLYDCITVSLTNFLLRCDSRFLVLQTNASEINFAAPLIHTFVVNSSGKPEVGLLSHKINAFVILIDFAKLLSLRITLLGTPAGMREYPFPHSLVNRVGLSAFLYFGSLIDEKWYIGIF